eukprot:Rhum_TRINITY_DN15481_c3_g2::Rhum_TRINITY_DN15481_c3_g2_i1::g.158817::m.158817
MGDAESGHFIQPPLSDPRITRAGEVLMSRLRVQWHSLLRTITPTGPVFTRCDCGPIRDFTHMLHDCPLTADARALLPADTPVHVLLCWREISVLEFLVSAGHVAGPASRYVVLPSAAVPSVVVAAAVSAAVVHLSACGAE